MQAVLDTNVLVSMALAASGRFEPILRGWRSGRFEVLSCPELLHEVDLVLARPKLARRLDLPAREGLLRDLAALTIPIALVGPWPEFRDPNDRFLLALARDGNAQVMVTGDAALLDLVQVADTVTLSPASFVEALESE